MEEVFSRHVASSSIVSGVYLSQHGKNDEAAETIQACEEFEKKYGRRPRILVAKMGQDGHDRGSKVIATGFADMGFDVDIGPLFQTPEEVAKHAIDSDVHAVGISSLAGGHKTLIPKLVNLLKNTIVVVGGVIPVQDYQFLTDSGVKAIFGPGSKIPECAKKVIRLIEEQTGQKGI